jgi:hypothetical protein
MQQQTNAETAWYAYLRTDAIDRLTSGGLSHIQANMRLKSNLQEANRRGLKIPLVVQARKDHGVSIDSNELYQTRLDPAALLSGFYRIIDNSGGDHLYSAELFHVPSAKYQVCPCTNELLIPSTTLSATG